MSYAEAVHRPRARVVALVLGIHVLIAYAFITGLAYTVVEQVAGELQTFDVIEPAPPAEVPAPEPAASENPTEVDVAPSPIPNQANPLSQSDVRGPPSPGADAASAAGLLRGAFNNDSDYPGSARRNEEQGTVRVSYTIGIDGRVSSCTIVQSSGSASLDSTTCRIFERRFRYRPARDAAGNSVAQTMSQAVTWQLLT